MIPTKFPEANKRFHPPGDLDESQCGTIDAYQGQIQGGSIDGCTQIITAWLPTQQEIDDINAGKPIFLCCIGVLPPHLLTTYFYDATHPA